jgi:hypothetical protein
VRLVRPIVDTVTFMVSLSIGLAVAARPSPMSPAEERAQRRHEVRRDDGLEPPLALACQRRLEDSIVPGMRTDEQKRALRDRDGQAALTYSVTSSMGARYRAGQAAYSLP